MLTYLLIVVSTIGIGDARGATVTFQEFKNKDDCQSAIHYIKSSTRAEVHAYCEMLTPERVSKGTGK